MSIVVSAFNNQLHVAKDVFKAIIHENGSFSVFAFMF